MVSANGKFEINLVKVTWVVTVLVGKRGIVGVACSVVGVAGLVWVLSNLLKGLKTHYKLMNSVYSVFRCLNQWPCLV